MVALELILAISYTLLPPSNSAKELSEIHKLASPQSLFRKPVIEQNNLFILNISRSDLGVHQMGRAIYLNNLKMERLATNKEKLSFISG